MRLAITAAPILALFAVLAAPLLAGCQAKAVRSDAANGARNHATVAGSVSLTLATGPRGGIYSDFGQGLARLTAATPAAALVPRTTRGAAENLALLERRQVQAALVNLGTAYEAWTGAGPWAGTQPMSDLRALMPLYAVPFQLIVLADSGIASLRDLDKRRVGIAVGPAKGPSELMFKELAANAGISPVTTTDTPSLLVEPLIARTIDAIWLAGELPNATVAEIAGKAHARLISLDAAETTALSQKFPALTAYTIPTATYAGQRQPVNTLALWNFVVVMKDLPEQTAYDLSRAILARPAASAGVLPPSWDPNVAAATAFLPYHPGAARWLRESANH